MNQIIILSNLRYHKQAIIDVEAVWKRTLQLLRQLGKPSDTIPEKDVKLFCRHASELCIQRGTSFADEYDPKLINTNEIGKIII
jgi:amyloid beta precursor protein binding protein 1